MSGNPTTNQENHHGIHSTAYFASLFRKSDGRVPSFRAWFASS